MNNRPLDPKSSNTGTPRQPKRGQSPHRQVHFANSTASSSQQTETLGGNINSCGTSFFAQSAGRDTSTVGNGPSNTGSNEKSANGAVPINIPNGTSSSSIPIQKSAQAPRGTGAYPNQPQSSRPPHSAGLFPDIGCHVSDDPTRSVSAPPPGWVPAAGHTAYHQVPFATQAQAHFSPHIATQFVPTATAGIATNSTFPPLTYIGPQQAPPSIMADYQNAAPHPNGVNFQPPVPDTTYGAMQHLYVPRFDSGFVGGQQHQPGVGSMAYPQQPGYVIAQQPHFSQGGAVLQQPQLIQPPIMAPGAQPMMIGGQPVMSSFQQPFTTAPPPVAYAGGAGGGIGGPPIITGNAAGAPDVSGIGRTPAEEQLRQVQFAYNNKLFEPQEFKPADDDPSRFYWVREKDGAWTQRNRYTIDNVGDHRWYVTDEGWFYAVRLND